MTWNTRQTRLLAILLVMSVLAAGLPAVVVAGGGAGSFSDNTVTVTRGDTVEITVSHSDTAHVFVGSERSGFLLEVVLSGSGTHTFSIDTYATTGSASAFHSGAGKPILRTKKLQRPIQATEYKMNVTVDGIEEDIGSLTVESRGEMNATTQIAPASLFDGDELTINTALDAASDNDTLARGDAAIFTINEVGFENALNKDDIDGDGNANGIAIQLTELDPEPNTNAETLVVSEVPGFTVHPDLENDRIYVLWDTGTRTLQPQSNHSWRMDVVLTSTNRLVDSDTTVATTRVQLLEPRVTTSGPAHRSLYPWESATVTLSGTTNLAPGTALNIRAKSIEPPFLEQSTVPVTSNGTFSGTLDISKASSGLSVPVWVLHHRDETERTVVRYDERANFAFHDQVSNSQAIKIDSVHLAAGGFVQVRSNDTRLGVSEYLSPGTHEAVIIDLDTPIPESSNVTVVAHLDRDLDGSFTSATDTAYRENDSVNPVTATAWVDLQGIGQTTTTTVSTTTTTTTTTNKSTTTMSTTTTSTTHLAGSGPLVERTPIPALAAAESGADVPFPGWAAVVAIVGAGLLTRRRGGESP